MSKSKLEWKSKANKRKWEESRMAEEKRKEKYICKIEKNINGIKPEDGKE